MPIILTKSPPLVQNRLNKRQDEFFRPPKNMNSAEISKLKTLSTEHLLLLYGIGQGVKESKELSELIQKHRSTTLKYLGQLESLNLIQSSQKPGTEKKSKPTKLYALAPQTPLKSVREIGASKGFDLEKLYQKRLATQTKGTEVNQSPAKYFPAEITLEYTSETTMANPLEVQIQTVLEQMASEIAELKVRITKLELEAQRRPQPTFQADEILKRLQKTDSEEKE